MIRSTDIARALRRPPQRPQWFWEDAIIFALAAAAGLVVAWWGLS